MTIEQGAFWNEPGGDYFRAAMEELWLEPGDLEQVRPEHEHISLPMGDYPTLDRVYAKAWELREAEGR